MAIITPPRAAYPGPQPIGRLEPSQEHYQADVEGIVLSQHYAILYYGRQHHGQLCPEQCFVSTTGLTVVLESLCVPRHHCVDLLALAQVDSDGGGTLRVTAVEAAVAVVVPFAAGVQTVRVPLPAVNRPDLLTTVEWALSVTLPGTWASIESFSLCDDDLAAPP